MEQDELFKVVCVLWLTVYALNIGLTNPRSRAECVTFAMARKVWPTLALL